MTQISKEYAGALFELAGEQDRAGEFSEALKLIRGELDSQPEYTELLSSPNIPIPERRKLIEEAFGAHVPEYVLSFTQLLCEKGHIRLFGECADEYEKMYTALKAVSDARVVSAVALTDGEKSALIAKLEQMTGNLVVPTYETDPSLIGGVVIYVGDTVIDGSLKSRLKDIKEVIGR